MPIKPSSAENEYFAREEVARRRKAAGERNAALIQEERERERDLHLMKCPKCGMPLEEIAFDEVRVDKCFSCEGLWLDKGELETIRRKDAGFVAKMLNIFGA